MTQNRSNQFIVGLFVIAGLASLFIALALITGRTGPTDTYYTVMNNVAGIKYGTPVVFEGYHIGQVDDIEPYETEEGMQFRLTLAVREDWRIPSDSQTLVSSPGILAGKTILIRGGQSPEQFAPGDTSPALGWGSLFAARAQRGDRIAGLGQPVCGPE